MAQFLANGLSRIGWARRGRSAPHGPGSEMGDAAETLGVKLGDYYASAWEMPTDQELRQAADLITPDFRRRLDASRDQMLRQVAQDGAGRRRARRVRIALAVSASVLGIWVGFGLLDPLGRDRPDRPWPAGVIKLEGLSSVQLIPAMDQRIPLGTGFAVDIPQGRERMLMTGYLSLMGAICSMQVIAKEGIVRSGGGGRCLGPVALSERLEREGATVVDMIATDQRVLVSGYTSAAVTSIDGRGWDDSVTVALGPIWEPTITLSGVDVPDVPKIRPFIAVAYPDPGPDGRLDPMDPRLRDVHHFGLEATSADGRSVEVGEWRWEEDSGENRDRPLAAR